MASTKKPKIRMQDWTAEELAAAARRLKGEIAKARMTVKAGRERNTRKAFILRKQLAKTLAIITQKGV